MKIRMMEAPTAFFCIGLTILLLTAGCIFARATGWPDTAPVTVGSVWTYDRNNPFENDKLEVVELKKGSDGTQYVQYRYVGSKTLFSKTETRFKAIYTRVE